MMSEGGGGEGSLHVVWVNQYAVTPDQPGGTRHYDMASALSDEGVAAEIVASDLNLVTRAYSRRRAWWDLRARRELVGSVAFTWLTAGSYSGNDWRRILSMVMFAARAAAHLLVRQVRPPAVFIGSSPHLFAALATWAVARLRRVPFVVEVRDLWPESYTAVSGRDRGVMVRVMRTIADLLYRRSDAVIVFAPANGEHVVGRGADPDAVHVIPNGVDLRQFDIAEPAAISLGCAGRFTFVYAGAHGPANGLDIVLDACAELRRRGDERVRVVFVGDGPAKGELRARAAAMDLANVEFLPPVTKQAIPATLRSADGALMILAATELFTYGVSPNKLFDYLAADLPVVTNVAGLVTEVVEASGAGVAAASGEAGSLADAMQTLASGGVTTRSGRAYVAAHHDRRVLARRLAAALRGVASGEQSGEVRRA